METITEAEFLNAASSGPAKQGASHSKGGRTEVTTERSPGGASLLRKKNLPDNTEMVIFANGNDPFLGKKQTS